MYIILRMTVSALTGQLQPNPIFTEFENTGGISYMNKCDSFWVPLNNFMERNGAGLIAFGPFGTDQCPSMAHN